MTCVNCGADSSVLSTRRRRDGTISRRRQCDECGCRFSTVEQPVAMANDRATIMESIDKIRTELLGLKAVVDDRARRL